MAPEATLVKEDARHARLFRRSFWWLDHKERVRKVGLGVLVGVEVLLIAIGVYAYVDAYLLHEGDEARIGVELASALPFSSVSRAQAPLDLRAGAVSVLASGKSFDILSLLENQNRSWIATVDAHYQMGGRATEVTRIVLAPGMQAPFVAFGLAAPRPATPSLVFDRVSWQRIDSRVIPDPLAWKDERLHLMTQDVSTGLAEKTGTTAFTETTFSLTNATGYGFGSIDLYVVLRRGGSPVAVNRVVVTALAGGETRPIVLRWFDAIASVSTTDFYPVVNVFDPDAYLAVTSTGQEAPDRRDAVGR